MNKKIIVIGGDGFCGWPTSLKLAKEGNEVLIIDNLSRRKIDDELKTNSLVKIQTIEERIKIANEIIGNISFKNIDICKDYEQLVSCISSFKPDAIVHFGEQRAAPYSMISAKERRYTVDNNVSGTHNILNSIVDVDKNIHLVHLGTMGVYGYSKDFGKIPEGYLNVCINQTKNDVDILYPANPGSVYHMTKCLDQLLFQFYNKNWGIQITDLHQGIVWGIETAETRLNSALANRFDYDGLYGTVLNRFLSQAVNGHPLTVYGTGGQTRAFIHISDTAKCIFLAIKSSPKLSKVRIFNQVSEVKRIIDLAKIISEKTGAEISLKKNPRKEAAENDLEVSNNGLRSIGFDPITLSDGLFDDVMTLAKSMSSNFNSDIVMNSPKW
jgi:UDP-sulfoquinovose synthase